MALKFCLLILGLKHGAKIACRDGTRMETKLNLYSPTRKVGGSGEEGGKKKEKGR